MSDDKAFIIATPVLLLVGAVTIWLAFALSAERVRSRGLTEDLETSRRVVAIHRELEARLLDGNEKLMKELDGANESLRLVREASDQWMSLSTALIEQRAELETRIELLEASLDAAKVGTVCRAPVDERPAPLPSPPVRARG